MPPLYDTFLVREPLRDDPFAVTHNPSDIATLIEAYSKSITHFTDRNRERAVERLQYELALLYVREQKWKKALRILLPLWEGSSWRREGWWGLLGLLADQVRECARRCGNEEAVVKVEWERMCDCFRRLETGYDFSRCLDGMEDLSSKPRAVVRAEESVACCKYVKKPSFSSVNHGVRVSMLTSPTVSTTFAFGPSQGNVGDILPAQVVITSHAQRSTAPIVFSRILISFDSGLKLIRIEHHPEGDPTLSKSGHIHLYEVTLSTEDTTTDSSSPASSSPQKSLRGTCDLSFSPGIAKAISFNVIPRESGTVRVASITSTIEEESFDLDHILSGADYMRQYDYWLKSPEGISQRPAGNKGLNEIRIHPKPPKMQINLPALRKEYLTDESVHLEVEITNEEEEDAEITLEARFLGQADAVPTLTWITDEKLPTSSEDPLSENDNGDKPLSTINLGKIPRSGSREASITFTAKSFPTEAVLEIRALYNLLKEPDTPISKVLIHEVIFDRPFEANYDFQPCVDTRPWPSYFHSHEGGDDDGPAQGLRQLWHSNARLASFASEPLAIEHIALQVLDIHDGAICTISNIFPIPASDAIIAPNDFHEKQFKIDAHKIDLDDRRSTVIQFQLQVRWRRNQSGATTATTTIPAPDLIIPFGEPRVLASAGPAQGDETTAIPLEYTIENPSTHVLNFHISMETSDHFAFSGPKSTTMNLMPVSRRTVRYNIVPLVRGRWITPQFRVLDTHFRQVLRVYGTGGMRGEKKGASLWVDAEE
ncbi:MAG: hypothetical protein Q9166_000324 [cf. Caloplaca sp. 2 TL-2023]